MEINGSVWFWPLWTSEVEFYPWTMSPGGTYTNIILDFSWPDAASTGTHRAAFIGGLLDPESWWIYDWDYVEFYW